MITLKMVLKANATSCILFAMIFLSVPLKTALFLGGDEPAAEIVFSLLGAILLFNGLHLIWASFKPLPSKFLILYFSIGDFIWAILSFALLFFGIWITTTVGAILSILVALMVTTFGVLQMIKRKGMGNC